jgi:dienelactone hydrolase
MFKTTLLVFLVLVLVTCFAQTPTGLKRKATTGFSIKMNQGRPGAVVSRVTDGSPAQKAGLRVGDQVVAINGTIITDGYVWNRTVQMAKAGEPMTVGLRTPNADLKDIRFTLLPAPAETHSVVALETIQLTNDYGDPLRAFVTKPKTTGKLPAILFVSWLSCSSVELRNDNWSHMMRDVVEKSGFIMLRLEKPGVGDSGGIDCAECDLTRELNGYRVALSYLKNRPDVDTTRIILFGGSLGGTLTSVVGQGQNIFAYVTAVSVYKTWLEHMIELERRRLQLSGSTPAEVSALMNKYISFHSNYLNNKETPAEVIRNHPEFGPLWYDDPAHQYGRPAKFYHDANSLNFMETWSKVKAPVLIVAGELDWIMSLDDGRLLNESLNKKSPGQSTFYLAKGMDHHWATYPNAQAAFDEANGVYAQEAVDFMVSWMKNIYLNR